MIHKFSSQTQASLSTGRSGRHLLHRSCPLWLFNLLKYFATQNTLTIRRQMHKDNLDNGYHGRLKTYTNNMYHKFPEKNGEGSTIV